jgi:CRP/FNR family transcriptional regulator, cyclic AMP receptor protein
MADDRVLALLSAVDLFAGLKPKVLGRIADSGEVVSYDAGATVLSAGEPTAGFRAFSPAGVSMHVIVSGSALVRVRDELVATLGPGAYFGELSLVDGGPRSADVAAGDSGLTTFALPKWSFDELLRDHPEVAVPMLRVVSTRLRRAEAREH